MYNAQNNQGCLHHPIWTVIATIVATLTLLVAIFVWFVPNSNALFSTQLPSSPQQSFPIPTIPQLKSSYSGTTTWGLDTFQETWCLNSQNQKGNINVTIAISWPFCP